MIGCGAGLQTWSFNLSFNQLMCELQRGVAPQGAGQEEQAKEDNSKTDTVTPAFKLLRFGQSHVKPFQRRATG